ncbi:MAG: calcium-binding protein [Solirubrobacterales bacterium]
MPKRFVARWTALSVVLLGTLLPAASAHAAFGISGAIAQPTNTQAGAHSNFHLSYNTTGDEDIRNLTTELPAGLVGNPQAAAFCVPTQFNVDQCPGGSKIGEASSDVTATIVPGVLEVPLSVAGDVYNMIPQGSDPATLGIILRSETLPPQILAAEPVRLIGHASARTTDFGLNTTILDIPRTAHVTLASTLPAELDIHIDTTSLILFGANPQFMTNPTSCSLATTRIIGTSYSGTTQTAQASFTPTNCLGQAYNPNLGVTVDMSKGPEFIDNPELTTSVKQGINEANSRRVEAILPSTIQANNSALNSQCPVANFQASTCARSTQVGSAVARTPLLSKPLEGPVYLIQNPGLLPRLGLDLRGPLPAKLFGNVTPTTTFRLDNVFEGLPDVPLTDFDLTFRGGESGLTVATDALCRNGSRQFDAIFDSHGGHHIAKTGNAKVIGCAFKKRLERNRCHRKKLTDVGSRKRDRIRGTRKRDVINALGGRDRIVGLRGNDVLCGGKGRDKVIGGAGNDRLSGGTGKDRLAGGKGKDKLRGGPGRDRQRQ